METLLFDHHKMLRLYNCSGKSWQEWRQLGHPSTSIGVFYISLGAFYYITYFPFMIVFLKSDLLKHSCYKIMFFLGLIDLTVIPIGSLLAGFFAIVGSHYCMYPRLAYVSGALGLFCWAAGSTTCMLLALNRSLELLSTKWAHTFFSGRRTLVWLLLPMGVGQLFLWLHAPPVFSSVLYSFFFDPFIGMPLRHGSVNSKDYPHMGHTVHNITVVIVMSACYALLLLTLNRKSRLISDHSTLQRRTTLQAVFICSGTFTAALLYVYMQFVTAPLWLVIGTQVVWQASHGLVGVVYLCFNPTMRRAALRLFLSRKYIASSVDKQTGHSNVGII